MMKSIALVVLMTMYSLVVGAQKNNTVDSLLEASGKWMDVQLDSAEQAAQAGLTLAMQLKLRNKQFLLEERLAMVALRRGNYAEAKAMLDQLGVACAKTPCDSDFMGVYHSTLGAYYYRTGDYYASGDNFLKAAEFYKKSSTPERAQTSLINSATVLMNTGGKQKSFKLFSEAVADPGVSALIKSKAYNNMGLIKASETRHQEAIVYFKKAIDIARAEGFDGKQYSFNLALAYEEQGQFTEALTLYQELAQSYASAGENRMLYKVYQGMANTYAALKNPVRALEYLKKAEENLVPEEQRMEYTDLLSMKHLMLANMGNYREAYKVQDEFYRDKMALDIKEGADRYMELQTQYETAQKELDIALQQKTIAGQRMMLMAGVVLLAGLLFFAGYIYRTSRQKDRLNKELREKKSQVELLHRELRHRISNNLSFITSLMQIQGRRLTNPEAQEVLFDSESRVRAMSLLHRKLNKDDGDYTRIGLKQYLEEILANLRQSYPFDREAPEIDIRIDDIEMDAERAMRIGLIINELVTNAYKHAFPERGSGNIALRIHRDDEGKIMVRYQDNGVGLPQEIDVDSSERLGMVLIRSLAGLLQSRPRFRTDNGTVFEMEIAA
jgi:two-component system, sensor histidine kinase PdtaS